MKVTAGIDIGGTGTKFGLVDAQGNILTEDKVSTTGKDTFRDYADDIIARISAQIDQNSDFELDGVGIGAPNGNYFRGVIQDAPNLPWKGDLPIVDQFKASLNIPVILNNDANAAAVGEMVYGAAKDVKDFIMITLGTGLGSGIISGGNLIMGADSLGGELGHVAIKHGKGRQCNCGKKGCLETYVSATGLKRTVYKFLADSNQPSVLRGISFDDLETKEVYTAAVAGDEVAIKSFEYTGKILGQALSNMVSVFNPRKFYLFGGLALAGDFIFEPTRKHLEKNILEMYKGSVEVLPSKLGSQGAAILGAASLVSNG